MAKLIDDGLLRAALVKGKGVWGAMKMAGNWLPMPERLCGAQTAFDKTMLLSNAKGLIGNFRDFVMVRVFSSIVFQLS